MNTDANEGADDKVLMPSTTSNEGIEAHLEAQSTVESSSTSEENHEEKSSGVQKRINDLTAKRYHAERERDELKAQLDKQAQATAQPQTQEHVSAPVLPDDLYDDEAMKKYHGDMVSYNQEAATRAATSVYESQQQKGVQQKQQDQHKQVLDTYVNGAIRDGVDLDKLKVAEGSLVQAGMKPELGQHIMSDVNGAKIAEYLADNPAEMYEILSMDPVSAGIKIATEIKPKVLATTPKVSNAPDPIPNINGGGGYIEKDDFDKTYAGYEII